jgi:hypothetical protein
MRNGKPIIYWDTCVFIAWLKNEIHVWGPIVMGGIDDVFQMVGRNEAYLVTSAITRSEIFLSTLTLEQKQKFADILRRKNVDERAADFKVTDRASELRFGFSIKTPDAIHLATATIAGADELQTLDGLNPKTGKCNNGMLGLNGRLKYKVVITPPYRRGIQATTPKLDEQVGDEYHDPQIKMGWTQSRDSEQPKPITETTDKLEADTTYTAPVSGSDGRRVESKAAPEGNVPKKAYTAQDKNEPPE